MICCASLSCSCEAARKPPLTEACWATTLVLPKAVTSSPPLLCVTRVPPAITPGLKLSKGKSASCKRNSCKIRAISNIAPSPTLSVNICDEWAALPVVVTCHVDAPRLAVTAVRMSPSASSKPRATSAHLAASISAFFDFANGRPLDSSSPVSTTLIFKRSSIPLAFNVLIAASMITLPPFISEMPGPAICVSSISLLCWKLSSLAKTVSKWPISKSFCPVGWVGDS